MKISHSSLLHCVLHLITFPVIYNIMTLFILTNIVTMLATGPLKLVARGSRLSHPTPWTQFSHPYEANVAEISKTSGFHLPPEVCCGVPSGGSSCNLHANTHDLPWEVTGFLDSFSSAETC